MTMDQMWNKLEEMGINEQTLNVVTSINGYNEKSMTDILYVVTGYNSFDQLEEDE